MRWLSGLKKKFPDVQLGLAWHFPYSEPLLLGQTTTAPIKIWSKLTLPSAVIFTFLGNYKSGELAPTGDSEEAAWVPPGEAVELVANSVMKARLRTLLSFDGAVTYSAYTVKPYQMVQEGILGGAPLLRP